MSNDMELHGYVVAWGRDESESCERLTPGCSVDHTATVIRTGDAGDCEVW